jgi:hypothetical protein
MGMRHCEGARKADVTLKSYKDFAVEIRPGERKGTYDILARGETGEAEAKFKVPIKPEEIAAFLDEVRTSSRKVSAGGQIPQPVPMSSEVGEKLHDALFTGAVRDIYVTALDQAHNAGQGLRLQLRLSATPHLADLPWEFLHNGKNFMLLSTETPLVYYLDLPEAPRPLAVAAPLRMLVTISGPDDLPPLDTEAEKGKLTRALQPLIDNGALRLDFAPDASLGTLQQQFRRARSMGTPYHIWHFIGHGAFDATQPDSSSILMFTDEHNHSTPVGGFQLGTMFNSYPELRLAVLNACQGARSTSNDPFNGVASGLVQNGIPAVIGMQFEISDSAAVKFSSEFYQALVDGLPVDAALAEARRAIFFMPNWVEWATPVLFMRVRDGTLFTFAEHEAHSAGTDDLLGKTPVTPVAALDAAAESKGEDDQTSGVPYTNKMIYEAYPRVVGPDDDQRLPAPWKLILKIVAGDIVDFMGIELHADAMIGREVNTSTGERMISLARFNANAMGVSREHAIFHPTPDKLFIIDNHSRNGMTINGVPAIPDIPYALHTGDQLHIAKMKIEVHFVDRQPR